MKQYFPLLISLIIVAIFFSNCKKDLLKEPLPATPATIGLRLNGSYLRLSQIDSVILRWEHNGDTIQLVQQPKMDSINILLPEKAHGKGILTIQLYTSIKNRGYKLQFEKRWQAELSPGVLSISHGPIGFNDPEWTPRVILEEKEWTNLVIVVGLRPDDPYFSISNIPKRWPQLGIARGFSKANGTRLLVEKIWTCDGKDKNFIEDRTYFQGLEKLLVGKDWGWVDVNCDVYSLTDNIVGFVLGFNCPRE